MHNSKLFSPMGSLNHRRQRLLAERGPGLTCRIGTIIIDNLDVVRAFLDPGVDEGLRLSRFGDRRNREAVLGSMPTGSGDQCTSGAQIGLIMSLTPLLE